MAEVPSQRRLQRAPDFTGGRLNTFRQIFLRHGLPGALLGIVVLAYLGGWDLLLANLTPSNMSIYLAWGVAIVLGLSIYAAVIDRAWRPAQMGWVVYLGLLSLWEEWLFRLALPNVLADFGVTLL